MSQQSVGVIGLGQMGGRIAARLATLGFSVIGYDALPGTRDQAAAGGIEVVTSASEVGRRADIVITSLPDLQIVREVLLGHDGVAAAAPRLIVDMSTGAPGAARALAADAAAAGLTYLDAPVTGGPDGAAAGTLGIMVGGSESAFEAARPVLEALGKTVQRCGDSGAGQIAKACNQLVVVATLGAVAEALVMAERSGIDAVKTRDVLLAGYAASPILANQGLRMLQGDFAPRGKARYNLKDIDTLRHLSAEHGLALPVFAAASGYIEELIAAGGADLDHSAIITVVRKQGEERA